MNGLTEKEGENKMNGLTEKDMEIINILGSMNRGERWDTMEKLLIFFIVTDIKEESYALLFDRLRNSVFKHLRDFKQSMDKTVKHGHA